MQRVVIDPQRTSPAIVVQEPLAPLLDYPVRPTDVTPERVLFAVIQLTDALGRVLNPESITVSSLPPLVVLDATPVAAGVWMLRAYGGAEAFGYRAEITVPGYRPVLATLVVTEAITGDVRQTVQLSGALNEETYLLVGQFGGESVYLASMDKLN